MKIIMTSDIHRNIDGFLKVKDQEYDYFLDAGDSSMSVNELDDIISVSGNSDFNNLEKYRIVSLDDYLRIFITHGVGLNIETIASIAKENKCNVALYGHTHIKNLSYINNVWVVNPGSITKPRNGNNKTYVIMDYDSLNKEIKFKFIDFSL